MKRCLVLSLSLLAACAQFPQVDAGFGPKDPAAPPARLIPLGEVGTSPVSAAPAPSLESRAARLRKRAAALRQ